MPTYSHCNTPAEN